MIYEATEADIPAILDMGEQFVTGNGWRYDRNITEKTVKSLIDNPMSVIFAADRGMIAGLLYPHYFNGELTGQELWWWSESPGTGARLLRALEDWAKANGARSFSMFCLENREPERLARFYVRRGYVPTEHHFVRFF